MRFIAEFEVDAGCHNKLIEACKGRYCLDIGNMIAESFGWCEKGATTLEGPVKERYTLEIEAFPMDKWIEFKNRLLSHIQFCNDEDRPADEIRVLQLMRELESFGKPAADAIPSNPPYIQSDTKYYLDNKGNKIYKQSGDGEIQDITKP